MRRVRHGALLALALGSAVLGLSAFKVVDASAKTQSEVQTERKAQDKLPHSLNPLWDRLMKCKVAMDKKSGLYSIALTPEVKTMAGRSADVEGFILPLDGSDKTSHFLLSRRTPVCLFCPPGEPNEVVEVKSREPVDWVNDPVTLRGRFELVNDGEKGVFFALTDAVPAPAK